MKFFTFLIFSSTVVSCTNSGALKWGKVSYDKNISASPIYTQLETQNEIFSANEADTSMKKTSDVTYVIVIDKNNLLHSSKNYNCRAYYFRSDTLSINIGIGGGFGGNGFIINYKDGSFFTEPYFSTDVMYPTEPEPVFKIIKQTLTLNKSQYKIGDSLYGKIYFHVIETKERVNTEHFGSGFFRTKIRDF